MQKKAHEMKQAEHIWRKWKPLTKRRNHFDTIIKWFILIGNIKQFNDLQKKNKTTLSTEQLRLSLIIKL